MGTNQALNSSLHSISTNNKENKLIKVCKCESNFTAILHIYSAPNGTYSTCRYIRAILSDKYIFADSLLLKGSKNIRLFKNDGYFFVYVYGSIWTRSFIEVFSDSPNSFFFEDVTDQINITDLTEIEIQ